MSQSTTARRSRQGPLTIWHMMTLGQMCRAASFGPQLHWSRAVQIALLPGMGFYNSVMRLAERMLFGSQIRACPVPEAPLFIIGQWRSGTTLLHNLLAQDPQFNFPTMYQAAFCNHFLLTQNVVTRLTGRFLPTTRPMDNLPAGWDIPQEEDIAIAIQCQISPYMLAADPDRMDKVRAFWDLADVTPSQRDLWRRTYLDFLTRVTLADPKRRRLVLKSPVNTLRIPLLLELFPNAQFVHICRNPLDVYNSCLHMRRTLFGENCLGRPHLRELEEAVFWVHEFGFRTYLRDRALIPPGRLHELRFEELEADPLGQLERVYCRLQLSGWDRLRAILEPQLPALKAYQKNSFPTVPERQQYIYDRLRPVFEHYGYPQPAASANDVAAA